MKTVPEMRQDALRILRAALAAADPRAAVLRACGVKGDALVVDGERYPLGRGRVIVVGAGKAGAPMAAAIEERLGDRISKGAVTVKYGHLGPTRRIKLNEAGHPFPDESGLRATEEILTLLNDLTPDDVVICLISGGGSALFELLVPGVTLDDLRALTAALLRSGATINEMNALRKHLSRVKGGGLARLAQPAAVISFILSDVLGSPLDVIASGPTAPDSSTFGDALAVLDKYGLHGTVPKSILDHLERGLQGEIPETPKPGNPLFERVANVVVADNRAACEAAVVQSQAMGYRANLLSTTLEGEARVVGADLAREAKGIQAREGDLPACLIAGGETTVTLHGDGKGGRAQELALAAAIELAGTDGIVLLSAGTDGTDGPTDADGAIADGTTVARAAAIGLDAGEALERNDSFHLFEPLGDLIVTGPTNTNVNDLVVVLVG